MVTLNGNSVGDMATYTCDLGFELIGNATTTCTLVDMDSAEFQPEPPSCRREYNKKYNYYPPGMAMCHSYCNLIFRPHPPKLRVWYIYCSHMRKRIYKTGAVNNVVVNGLSHMARRSTETVYNSKLKAKRFAIEITIEVELENW